MRRASQLPQEKKIIPRTKGRKRTMHLKAQLVQKAIIARLDGGMLNGS
jgi:hypothetical protein